MAQISLRRSGGMQQAQCQQNLSISTESATLATKSLARGMGTYSKRCGCARPTNCPHPYTIRFRNAAGRQTEESGYRTQQAAVDRLTEIYQQRRSTPQAAAQEAHELGQKQFKTYAEDYIAKRRDWSESRSAGASSSLGKHIYPELQSRRIESFTPSIVERFIETMERNNVGIAAQDQVFVTLKTILLSAHKKGAIQRNPLTGVVPPQYDPERAVVPNYDTIQLIKTQSSDFRFRLVADLMTGMGLRNGEALAVNIKNLVADDVYRVSEQVSANTNQLTRLKHRKLGEFREVPMPQKTRAAIETYAKEHGTFSGGYLLAGANKTGSLPHMTYRSLNHAWKQATKDLPLPDGLVMYGFRHFFASNALSNGIPITDVAEWMGHKSIEITYRIYRHLMPSSITRAAKILNMSL
ncbi:tyrosine-type recombinase/integrase [Streptomyces sp. NPDC087317]|uniref:tyrosine-type recombinase/integrase n=1 Tax=Streptomyces sp. NPDC087317 TaxID=3365784 RepID=UPI00382AA7E5